MIQLARKKYIVPPQMCRCLELSERLWTDERDYAGSYLLPRNPEFRFETQLRRQSDISRETSVGSWSLTNSLSFIQPTMC